VIPLVATLFAGIAMTAFAFTKWKKLSGLFCAWNKGEEK
jgi:hypothetical protein